MITSSGDAGSATARAAPSRSAIAGNEPTAWTHVQLGKLYFSQGRTAEAARQYRLALAWQNVGYNQPPHPSVNPAVAATVTARLRAVSEDWPEVWC